MIKIIIGAHLSVSNGFYHMGVQARDIGANTFQFFTRNPRGSKAKDLDLDDINKMNVFLKENNFGRVLAHAPYTLNPASSDDRIRGFALEVMADDISRLENIPDALYNLHPGSHVKQGVDVGIELIIQALNQVIKEEQSTLVLLETMAGKGTEIGGKFQELATIIDGINHKDKIGVCLDTCHIYDGSYDIINNLDGVLEEFDSIIGLDRLKAIHLNDSKNPYGSKKDRHEKIGEGTLGLNTFKGIINHPKLRHLPFFLETPNEIEGYREEISLLRSLYKK